MKHIILLLPFLFVSFTVFPDNGWREGEKEIKVYIYSESDAKTLHNLKLNGEFYHSYALIYATDEELYKLKDSGLEFSIQIDDLNEHFRDFWKKRDEYHSYEEIIDLMDSLVMAFPHICAKKVYGTSVGGRELSALKISDNVSVDEAEAEVLFDAGIHGDEIGGPENLIRFARDLCYAYNEDAYITDLINDREIWLYIMVNPDGRVNMSRYNENGVDLNRDAGYMWDADGNSLGAFSQIESKKLRDCIYEHQFVIHTTYHSGTQFVSYPWSYRPQQSPDHDHIDFLAELYATSSDYPGLSYGQGNTGMYAINGSTKDYNYGALGSVSWSMEISYAKQPPASQIMQYYNYNKPAMLTMIEYAGYGIKGVVTDTATGEAVEANIFIGDGMPVLSDKINGDYHKYVLAGTYTIKVIANGYQSKIISGVQVPDDSSIIVKNIQLRADPSHHAGKIVGCRIPGNNQGDEGMVEAGLGPPDQQNYSIGKNGWVVYDVMETIRSAEGPDVIIYEGDDSPENYHVYASNFKEGPWYNLGSGSGTTEFELSGVPFGQAKYLKIEDDGDGPSHGDNMGFDLDAIEVINAPKLEYVSFSVTDTTEGNGDLQINPGEIVDIHVDISNRGINPARFAECQLQSQSPYITFHEADTTIQQIKPADTATATFVVSADYQIQAGQEVEFSMILLSNNGHYADTVYFSFTTGGYVLTEEKGSLADLRIYPNPFKDQLQLGFESLNGNSVELSIYDLSGRKRLMKSYKKLNTGTNQVILQNIGQQLTVPGVYLLHLKSKHHQITRKILRSF